jgi:hypothetical protein
LSLMLAEASSMSSDAEHSESSADTSTLAAGVTSNVRGLSS